MKKLLEPKEVTEEVKKQREKQWGRCRSEGGVEVYEGAERDGGVNVGVEGDNGVDVEVERQR